MKDETCNLKVGDFLERSWVRVGDEPWKNKVILEKDKHFPKKHWWIQNVANHHFPSNLSLSLTFSQETLDVVHFLGQGRFAFKTKLWSKVS